MNVSVYAKSEGNLIANRLSLGLNYPGINVKYSFLNNFALDVHYQGSATVGVAGTRACYYYVFPKIIIVPYLGLELDYLQYKNQQSNDWTITGSYVGGLLGVEYFFSRVLSVCADIGYGNMNMASTTVSDVSYLTDKYVANIGLNLYITAPKQNIGK
ncbi:MAG: hypothetical protein WC955_12205 [Elusimicrobiota bacterium]